MHTAIFPAEIEMLTFLLSNESQVTSGYGSIDLQSNYRRTPLHIVSLYGKVDHGRILVSAGISLNSVDKKGNTPLYLAASARSPEMISFLVEKGANVLAKNEDGEYAYDIARPNEYLAQSSAFRQLERLTSKQH